MAPLFIVAPATILHFLLGSKAQEPVCIEAFGPEASVEGFDEGIVGLIAGREKSSVTPR